MNGKNPELSIGFPVFDGEMFLKKRLESILSQSFTNFELIISNNASTDDTDKICKEFLKKDSRIKYHHHEKNMGGIKNFNFVLTKATAEFFVWAAVDDRWKKDFIEKHLIVLKNNPNVVGCTSKVEVYGNSRKSRDVENGLYNKIINCVRKYFSKYGTHPAFGKYEKKIRIYLKANSAQSLYSVFRTFDLKKSFVNENIVAFDLATILNVLKYGDIYVINEILCEYYDGGASADGVIKHVTKIEGKLSMILPYSSFLKWCWKNLGKKKFLQNLDCFLKIIIAGHVARIYQFFLDHK